MWCGRRREEREQTQMTHRIILTALLLLLSGCQKTPEQARKELAELGVEFSPSVFHESVENGDVVVVELFLTAGMSPDITDEDGVAPLNRAVMKNNVGIARALLDSGAKVDIQKSDITLLDAAVLLGYTEMVRLLAGAGAEISRFALTDAKLRGDTEIVELFESIELIEADYESLAMASIRRILSSQIAYRRGSGNYATDLEALRSEALGSVAEPSSDLEEIFRRQRARRIDSALGSGTKDGYAFSTSGDADTFTVNARPLTYGSTGSRSFFSDESGVIRYTREDRPATVEDSPLEQ